MIRAELKKIEEQLGNLESDFFELKQKLSDQENIGEGINSTFQRIHNLKSSLFLLDQNESLKLSYMLEQQFEKLRSGKKMLLLNALDVFLQCLEWIKSDLGLSENCKMDKEVLTEELLSLMKTDSGEIPSSKKLILTADEKALLRDARNSDLNIFFVEYPLELSIGREEYSNLVIFKKINEIGMIAVRTPEYVNLKNDQKDNRMLKVVFVTDCKQKELKDPVLKKARPFDEDLYMTQRDYKILIIEDNPVAQLLQKNIMSDFGVCDTVDGGEAGIDLFSLALEEKSPYDIILLDLVMPGMGGADVLKKIRKIENSHHVKGLDRSKVVVSTTTTESATLMDLFRAEADSYIFKPLTKEKITREMTNLKLI